MSDVIATNQTILVVGGGISGMTAAIEAAECGKQVILLEKNPSLAAVSVNFTSISPSCVIRPAAWKSICAASRQQESARDDPG